MCRLTRKVILVVLSVSSASNLPGTDKGYDNLLEPIVKNEFEENTFLNLSVLWQRPLGIEAC